MTIATFSILPTILWHLFPPTIGRTIARSIFIFQSYAARHDMESIMPSSLPDGSIIGYHPHNSFPVDVWCWLECHNILRNVVVLASSSGIHFVPIYGLLLWYRGLVASITKYNFVNMLRERKSVLILPGGVDEMLRSVAESKDIVISTRHKGKTIGK